MKKKYIVLIPLPSLIKNKKIVRSFVLLPLLPPSLPPFPPPALFSPPPPLPSPSLILPLPLHPHLPPSLPSPTTPPSSLFICCHYRP